MNSGSHQGYLRTALDWAREHYPTASPERHSAFANSVAYVLTGMACGRGGPSVREYVAVEIRHQPNPPTTLGEAIMRVAASVFGPLTDAHREAWQREHCFDDDPNDLTELQGDSSTDLSPNGRN